MAKHFVPIVQYHRIQHRIYDEWNEAKNNDERKRDKENKKRRKETHEMVTNNDSLSINIYWKNSISS